MTQQLGEGWVEMVAIERDPTFDRYISYSIASCDFISIKKVSKDIVATVFYKPGKWFVTDCLTYNTWEVYEIEEEFALFLLTLSGEEAIECLQSTFPGKFRLYEDELVKEKSA